MEVHPSPLQPQSSKCACGCSHVFMFASTNQKHPRQLLGPQSRCWGKRVLPSVLPDSHSHLQLLPAPPFHSLGQSPSPPAVLLLYILSFKSQEHMQPELYLVFQLKLHLKYWRNSFPAFLEVPLWQTEIKFAFETFTSTTNAQCCRQLRYPALSTMTHCTVILRKSSSPTEIQQEDSWSWKSSQYR